MGKSDDSLHILSVRGRRERHIQALDLWIARPARNRSDQCPVTIPVDGRLGRRQADAGGLHELCVHHGPGYRVYDLHERQTVIVLCAGDKASQERDIERAGKLADDWRQR